MQHYSHFFRILVVVLFFCRAVPALSAPRYLMLDNPVRVSFSGFAFAMAVARDGDGANDLLIGAYDAQAPYEAPQHPAEHQGQAFVFSSKSGKLLFTLNVPVRMPYATFDDPYPHQGASFGYSLASPGDLDGDKIPDFAFGASGQSIMDKVAAGRVFVFRSQQ